jgi:hypothetical protein
VLRFLGMVCWSILAINAASLFAQVPGTFDLHGKLRLVDLPPDPTPPEAWRITLHPLTGGADIQASPDSLGSFVLKGLKAKRYSLDLHAQGRIVSFATRSSEKNPGNFELSPDTGDLRILVSLKTAQVTVNLAGSSASNRVIVLCPSDAYLTLRTSCMTNAANGAQQTFQHVTPGTYRVFVVDAGAAHDVATYAPSHPGFLTKVALPFSVLASGGAATAQYVDSNAVHEAVEALSNPR